MDSEDKIHGHLEVMSKCDHDVLLKNEQELKPIYLPLSLLTAITENFSDGLQIRNGGFAVVYKGLLKRGGTVAVKKLLNTICMNDNQFQEEVRCLMRVRHKNIVRFLGYCADTQGRMEDYKGKLILADERQRLLCFEYLPNGSLEKYINDAFSGLEWNERYKIIKGICEGLQYLHENNIVHLDLKPANILLSNNMVPKISDFGHSRCFEEMQSRIVTSTLIGSIGYLAPEFFSGEITRKLDIYSLGVIIAEMLTGQKGHSPVENVLECWRKRFQESYPDTDKLLEQVRVCTMIRISCGNLDPTKRPDIQQITAIFNEWSNSDVFPKTQAWSSSHSWSTPVENMQIADNSAADRVEIPTDGASEWEIDVKLLKFGNKVASGSYGDLYRGTYCSQDVAIKVLKPERINADMQREFAQEVYIMRKVRHKNVVQFIGASTKPPNLCIVTEFMSGGSVYDYLHKHKGVFKLPALVGVAMDVSKGMSYLHQNNIIHRDLKTANLLMDENGTCKIHVLFVTSLNGNSWPERVPTLPNLGLAQSGVMTAETGTYRWMAPEVIEHRPYDHKADVFSFGILMWELLTGKIPYEYLTPLQAAVGVVQKGLRPTIPKHTHARLSELLQKCWQQDPAQRPDFSEILETLQIIAKEVGDDHDGKHKDRTLGGFFSALRGRSH